MKILHPWTQKNWLCQQVGAHIHGQFWWCSKPPQKPTRQHISVHLHPLISPLSPTQVCSARAYWYKQSICLWVGFSENQWNWLHGAHPWTEPLVLKKSFTLVTLPLLLLLLDRYHMTMWSSPLKVSFPVLYVACTTSTSTSVLKETSYSCNLFFIRFLIIVTCSFLIHGHAWNQFGIVWADA